MSDPLRDLGPGPAPAVPTVDHPGVAAALARLEALDAAPLSEHTDRLAAVHEVLHSVLHADPAAAPEQPR